MKRMIDSGQMDLLSSHSDSPMFESHDAYEQLMQLWVEAQWVRDLDIYFVQTLKELAIDEGETPVPDILFVALLLSHQTGRGHVCIDIQSLCADPENLLSIPPVESHKRARFKPFETSALTAREVLKSCSESYLKQVLGDSLLVSDGSRISPIVFDGKRLYLRRLWLHESEIVKGISKRLGVKQGLERSDTPMARLLKTSLSILFGDTDPRDYQKSACALAARSLFSVITGGPGTGKTTTVVRLLAALQSMAEQDPVTSGRKYRIQLAAPTGKAAARLKVSIAAAVNALPLDELPGTVKREDIPTSVTTLHRLLGSKPKSRAFKQDANNPLMLDVLVIDEASMVDIYMLAAVMNALPPKAQLILIGDKDQLASVEVGAVLGELCNTALDGGYRDETVAWMKDTASVEVPAEQVDHNGLYLNQSLAMLRRSYRFSEQSGISRLASAVNTLTDLAPILDDLKAGLYSDIEWIKQDKTLTGDEISLANLIKHSVKGFSPYLKYAKESRPQVNASRQEWEAYATELLKLYGQFQLLVAVRQGHWGVDNINRLVTAALQAAGLIDKLEFWFHGRPVMVSSNDYTLDLWNGDLGLTLAVPWGEQGADVLRVAFPATNDEGVSSVRWVSPSRLPAHETVFAMTVHKSQGSEFEHCCLVLPQNMSQLISRELIYTAITRARTKFSIYTQPRILLEGSKQRVIRASGLRARLLMLQGDS